MAIDPTNDLDYFNEDGTIRRRDNVAMVLTEGDVLIDHDGEPYRVDDGEITIFTSGKRTGDGTLTLIEKAQVLNVASSGHQVWNIDELGLPN